MPSVMARGFASLLCAVALAACGGVLPPAHSVGTAPSGTAPRPARWPPWRHETRPLDLAGPLRDGSLVLAAAGRLWTLNPSTGRRALFSAAYNRPGNAEPYIAVPASGHRGCSYGVATAYVLRLYGGRGVVAVRRRGPVRRFAALTAPGLIDGIAFDETGRFGHRLLITITDGPRTTVQAIDCHGRVRTITATAPRAEGGIVVAPARFGRFGGALLLPDEKSGRIYAVGPAGRTQLIVSSGLPYGQDIGVESEVTVPASGGYGAVLGADRLNPGNRHPGDNAILRIGARALRLTGVRPGDLLVGTEGGARLVDVRCGVRACAAREVAAGPARAHLEGHLVVAPR